MKNRFRRFCESSRVDVELSQKALAAARLLGDIAYLGDKELDKKQKELRMQKNVRAAKMAAAIDDIKEYRAAAAKLSNERVGRFAGSTLDESIDDDIGGSWFDEYGYIIKDIPEECVHDCCHPGKCDDDCEFWVNELEFDKDFPVEQAKKYLKSTGGWEDEEIESKDAHELAIIVLWIFCGYLKDEGMDYPLSLDA